MLNFTREQLNQIVESRGPNRSWEPIPDCVPTPIFERIVEYRAKVLGVKLPTETLEDAIAERDARRAEVAALQASL